MIVSGAEIHRQERRRSGHPAYGFTNYRTSLTGTTKAYLGSPFGFAVAGSKIYHISGSGSILDCGGNVRPVARLRRAFWGPEAREGVPQPAVTSCMPALLPYYRQRKSLRKESAEYHLMVFRGPVSGLRLFEIYVLTRKAVASEYTSSVENERHFSAEDRGEIHRMSRMILR